MDVNSISTHDGRPPFNVVVLDASPVYREGLAELLGGRFGDTCVSVCGDAEVAFDRCVEVAGATVLVVDVALPYAEAFALLYRLRHQRGKVRTLVMCESAESPLLAEALVAGADGLFLKSLTADDLVAAVNQVAQGAVYISPGIQARLAVSGLADAKRPSLIAALTRSERSVSLRLVEGRTPREIAGELGISVKTVDTQRLQALKKLGIRNVADLTRLAVAQRLTRLD